MAVLATTRNFVIESPLTSPGTNSAWAWAHAPALAQTCEGDLVTLSDLFVTGGEFGSNNPVHVVIQSFPPPPPGRPESLGHNLGYKTQGATRIQITPLLGDPNPDEVLRAVFVHELAEILMTERKPQVWIPGDSMGEALAIVCQSLLHPEGYNGLPTGHGGPRVGGWLNFQQITVAGTGRAGIVKDWHRPNWIDKTDNANGDADAVAVGCGILFIHYLRWLGYSMNEIIASGAPTFGQLFFNLTKQGAVGAWKAFTDLINLHFPEMPDPIYPVTTDDLFPLPSLIRMTLSPSSVTSGDTVRGTVELDAPQKATLVTLFSSSPEFATVKSPATIPVNSTKGTFDVTTPFRYAAFPTQSIQIWGSSGGNSVVAELKVHSPLERDTGILKSVSISPATVLAGTEGICTLELESAVSTDTIVGLAAVDSGGGPGIPRGPQSTLVSVPSRKTIPQTQTTAQFPIQTSSDVLPHTTRTVTVAANAVVTKTATLTIEGG